MRLIKITSLQVNASKAKDGAVRREPVISEHPLVRTHPVTGEKALYVNPQCKWNRTPLHRPTKAPPVTRNIVGYKQEESDALLVRHLVHPQDPITDFRRNSFTITLLMAPISKQGSNGPKELWSYGTIAS